MKAVRFEHHGDSPDVLKIVDLPDPKPGINEVLVDLKAESDRLWNAVSGLDDAGWATPTPAPGWTVATQVAHLLWTDEVAVIAATDNDKLVGWKPIARAAARLGDCELVHFGAEGRHELLRECDAVRGRALAACDALLARLAAG